MSIGVNALPIVRVWGDRCSVNAIVRVVLCEAIGRYQCHPAVGSRLIVITLCIRFPVVWFSYIFLSTSVSAVCCSKFWINTYFLWIAAKTPCVPYAPPSRA